METSKIQQKASKLLELSIRGVDGEAKAAKRALLALLEANGMTIEDLSNNARSLRYFKMRDSLEKTICWHCILKMFGKGEIYTKAHYSKEYREVWIDLTDIEYLDFQPFLLFHLNNFRKEKKKLIDTLAGAYVNKHDLFCKEQYEEAENREYTEEDFRRLKESLSLQKIMEDKTYHKQLK